MSREGTRRARVVRPGLEPLEARALQAVPPAARLIAVSVAPASADYRAGQPAAIVISVTNNSGRRVRLGGAHPVVHALVFDPGLGAPVDRISSHVPVRLGTFRAHETRQFVLTMDAGFPRPGHYLIRGGLGAAVSPTTVEVR